jgi:hypothetical protein
VNLPLVTAILPWLLSPACGALAGYGLGRLALRTLLPSIGARRGPSQDIAALVPVDALSSWLLAIPVARILPENGSPAALSLELTIADFLRTFLGSRGTIYAVRDAVSNLVARLAARNAGEVSRELGLQGVLADRLLPALLEKSNRESVSRAAGAFLAGQAGVALDDDVIREVAGVFESYVPEAADATVRWLRSAETRAVLSERGRELLPRIVEKLSEMQKLFISAGQFDRRLNEKMPEIIDETIQAVEKMVRDPLQQKRIVGLFFDSARDWRDSLLVTPADAGRPWKDARQKLSGSASLLLGRLLSRLDEPSTRQSAAELAGTLLQGDRRTVGAFFRDVFGVRDSEIVEAASSVVLKFLTRPESAREIARRICSLIFSHREENAQATLGSVLGIDAERKGRLDDSLRAAVPRWAKQLVPLILPAMGEALASSRRVNSLAGLFGAAVGLVVGLLLVFLRLIAGT